MALDQSALLELLDVMRSADGGDLMRRLLATIVDSPRPTIVFDSPFRVLKSLALIAEVLPERQLTVGRELTKVHEQVLRGTASELISALGERARGEFTLVISGRDRPPGT